MAPWKKAILKKYQKSANKKKLFKSKHKAKKSVLKKCKIIVDQIHLKSDSYRFGTDLDFEQKLTQIYAAHPKFQFDDSMVEKHLMIDEQIQNEIFEKSESENKLQIGTQVESISYAVEESKFNYKFEPVKISFVDFIRHKFTPVEARSVDYGIPEAILEEMNEFPIDLSIKSAQKPKPRKSCCKSLKF